MIRPPKLKYGDRVAIVSPSWAAPSAYPEVHELAMRRIVDLLGLEPVEYPSTRAASSPARRAADLMAAWSDPSVRAVFATIGGSDQITVLPHLDPAPFLADRKPFFGFSDNTNLLNWLWRYGLAGYHGGSTHYHLSVGGGVDEVHLRSLRAALFERVDLPITPLPSYRESNIDWRDPAALTSTAPMEPSEGWVWHRPDRVVTGPTWGGCLEIVHWNLAADRWMLEPEEYAGSVLLLETSEEMPSASEVFRSLRNAGERGLLEQFPAVVVARPRSDGPAYRDAQREAVLRALAAYNPSAMAVFGVDFGHTAPQWILPYGGRLTVNGPERQIIAHF